MITRDRNADRKAGRAGQRRGSVTVVAETAVRLLGFSSSGVRPRTTMAAQLIAQRIRGKKPLTLTTNSVLRFEPCKTESGAPDPKHRWKLTAYSTSGLGVGFVSCSRRCGKTNVEEAFGLKL